MPTWLIFTLTNIISMSLVRILQKTLVNKSESDPIAYNIYFQLIVASIIFVFAAIRGFNLNGYDHNLLNMILMVFLYGIGGTLLFMSMKNLESSKVTIIMSSASIWSILSAMFFLNESLNLKAIIGILLIIVSIIIVSYSKSKLINRKGLIQAVLASIFFGLAFTNDLYISQGKDAATYAFISFLLPSILLIILFPKKFISNIKIFKDKNFILNIFVLSFFYSIANISIFFAYQSGGQASLISPLLQLAIILVVILSAIFLKERENLPRKFIGSTIAVIGIVLTLV